MRALRSHRRAITAAALACALSLAPRPTLADDDLAGVVVALSGADVTGVQASAESAGGATWRVETLEARPMPEPPAPTTQLDAIEALYDAGDFPRCLTQLNDPVLDLTRLLTNGHRGAAARLLLVSAACTAGAGDADRARELFTRALVRELDLEVGLGELRPDIVQLADEARQRLHRASRARLVIDSPGARVTVDGRSVRCDRSPCAVRLYRGSHVLVLEALGRARRVEQIELSEDQRIAPRLDLAAPELAREQLAGALAGSGQVHRGQLGRAAANAYDARVVVLLDERGGRVRASVYDRARRAVVAQSASDAGPGASALVVRRVIDDWRGAIADDPEWWVWAIVAGSVLVAGIATFFLLLPELSTHSFRFSIE